MFSSLINLAKNTITESHESDKGQAADKPLDWRDRPKLLQLKILFSWFAINHRTFSTWRFKGEDEKQYNIGNINEFELVKDFILNHPGETEFNILDIGAGQFGFGRGLGKFLNQISDITSRKISVNIIGITGERTHGPERKQIGICTLIELGYFQIENLIEQFNDKGFFLDKKINCIFSTKCFRHLVDPVGAIVQAYNLLKPGMSLFLFDADFDYVLENKSLWSEKRAKYLCELFSSDMQVEFEATRKSILLRRTNDIPCQLPLKYLGYEESYEESGANYSGLLTKFTLFSLDKKISKNMEEPLPKLDLLEGSRKNAQPVLRVRGG